MQQTSDECNSQKTESPDVFQLFLQTAQETLEQYVPSSLYAFGALLGSAPFVSSSLDCLWGSALIAGFSQFCNNNLPECQRSQGSLPLACAGLAAFCIEKADILGGLLPDTGNVTMVVVAKTIGLIACTKSIGDCGINFSMGFINELNYTGSLDNPDQADTGPKP